MSADGTLPAGGPDESAAYHCGRLLALFQQIQDLASGGVGASYSDRYFGAASTAPANTLPRVFRTARHRVRQIRGIRLKQDLLASLVRVHSQIESRFPKFLRIEQQGEFQLGYFHQMAAAPRRGKRVRIRTRGTDLNRKNVVQSAGEHLIFRLLHDLDVPFEYEAKLPYQRRDGAPDELTPDFHVRTAVPEIDLWIEYRGMAGSEEYERQWNYKDAVYRNRLKFPYLEDVQAGKPIGRSVLWVIEPEDLYGARSFQAKLREVLMTIFGGIPRHGDETTPF